VASASAADSDSTRSQPIRVKARVTSNQSEGGGNHRIVLEVGEWPDWQAGQFVMLSPGPESAVPRYDPLLPRPMAIFSSQADPGSHRLTVLYKVEGRGTRLIAEARVGDHLRVMGPLGRGFALPSVETHSILVGGGTGVASLFALAKSALASGPVTLVLGARSAELLMAVGEFEKLGVDLRIVTEDGSRGTRGLVTDVLRELLEAADASTRVFACGPTAMMRACSELAQQENLTCEVALENRMACGFGVCLGCAVPMAGGGFSLVCHRGPVYDARDLDWQGIP
jgi:dihydroorotate dehydrogenase electron transfer subunit